MQGKGAAFSEEGFADKHTAGKTENRRKVTQDGMQVVGGKRNAQQYQVSGHGIGKDVTMAHVDHGIHQAGRHGEQHNGQDDSWPARKRIRQGVGVSFLKELACDLQHSKQHAVTG